MPTPKESGPEDLLEATLELAQTQLLAQLADGTSLDGRTMGVLGFLGALLAADIAAKSILGSWWWTPLIGIGVAVVPCVVSVFTADTRLGPAGLTFYREYGGQPSRLAREQLLADLNAAYDYNVARVRTKLWSLRAALIITIVGLVASSVVIALDRPSRINDHGRFVSTTTATSDRTNSGARSVTAASSDP